MPRLDETRQRVNVVVGDVGALDARRPDDFLRAHRVQQQALDFGLAAFVAVGVDEAAFVRNQRAVAVGLYPAGFAHQAGVEHGQAEPLGHALGDLAVVAVDLLVAPAVEVELGDGDAALVVDDDGGPESRHHRSSVGTSRSSTARETLADGAVVARGGQHHHRLEFGDGVGDLRDAACRSWRKSASS